ncbi:MAG: ferrochelatase [Porticoccaceae bacterium]
MSEIKLGVILVNLGTPSAPTAKAVARFLRQFLSDQRVVEVPRWLWWVVLNGIIVPLRAKKIAHAYRGIWTDRGSPLRVITEDQATALQTFLDRQGSEPSFAVTYAMTYGGHTVATRVVELHQQGVGKIIVLPLYPQYSATTTAAVYDQLAALTLSSRNVPDVTVIKHYCQYPEYIETLARSVLAHWRSAGRNQKLLISFHGIPKDYIEKGDPYYAQCAYTATAVANRLQLTPDQWAYGFQSRFGRQEWIKPYADILLKQWVATGVASVDVICPSFSADCLETLEEMAIRNRELFLGSGGDKFALIPCLNAHSEHIEMLAKIISKQLSPAILEQDVGAMDQAGEDK